ncbi:DUF1648 domain-containing protein [Bradyrhizobium sp. URHD0069]|uniref:DUF1648 domain-containing protein n=1 Tax=Bradyrhizobium sp. URHD0069 TaxID=1380355 RepID=UPI0012DF0F63|nr:DUF1648 domain-containing protein [Bradyrhizobium sp. URHD0069]
MADYAFWPAVASMAGCNLYFGPRIRYNRMAMQWGFNGQPTWYAPKALGLWGMVAFALAIRLLIWAASTYVPEKLHGADIGLLLFSVIVAVVHVITLRAAARAN